MPNKNLTDNEVIKALECCSEANNCGKCEYEPTQHQIGTVSCCNELMKDALDLIDRLQADNEQLKSDISVSRDAYMSMKDRYEYEKEKVENAKQKCIDIAKALKTAKAEAYKEFAEEASKKLEKVRQKYQRLCKEQGEEEDEVMNIHYRGIKRIVNNLVKEMVGENNGN